MVTINPRKSWGAKPVRSSSIDPSKRVARSARTGFVIHHTVTSTGSTPADVPGLLRGIQNGHFGRGYNDIGYNYLIDKWGGIWEGRGIDNRGAHAGGANTVNIGVAFIGNNNPTPAAEEAFKQIYAWCNTQCKKTLKRYGHRDINSTACPGDRLYSWLKSGGLTQPAKPTLRSGSLISLVQAQEVAGWLARPYNSGEYVYDVQTWAIKIGALPKNGRDGVYGPMTAKGEKAVWEHYLKPKPAPVEPPPVVVPPVVVPPVEPPVVPPVEPPVDPPIEPPVEPTEPPNAKPAVNKWAALIVGIVGLGTLIAGIVSGFFQ